MREFGITIKLYSTDILFGVQRSNTHTKKGCIKKINHVILIAKKCTSIFKKTNSPFFLFVTFENQLLARNV